ncbi:hypothetical protein AB0E27_40220 [Streptomyces sparsogenes]|uniref:hypothetical protein n=1 Tax=Streptomyces sparsogenes TaxID=67365 RepID=UPI0033E80ED1
MTVRRTLGPGPQAPASSIRAAEADLLDTVPGGHLLDLEEMRARGVLGTHTETSPDPRRTLGAGGRADADADKESPHPPAVGEGAGSIWAP